jgi:hypothetical protein
VVLVAISVVLARNGRSSSEPAKQAQDPAAEHPDGLGGLRVDGGDEDYDGR